MKRSLPIALLLLASIVCMAQTPDPAKKLRDRADNASEKDCAKVCFEAAHAIAEAANKQFDAGNVPLGHQWMNDAVEYARRGTEASIKTHKREKHAEISLRKLGERIKDIGDSLSLDDRPPVYEDAKAVEALRNEMLTAMFGTPAKSLEPKKKKK